MFGFLTQKTSIAGVPIPNWLIVLGAIVVMLMVYEFAQEAKIPQ